MVITVAGDKKEVKDAITVEELIVQEDRDSSVCNSICKR